MASPQLRRVIWERDAGICGICKEPVAFGDMELDHVFPRSHGGPDDPANLQPSHEPCNRRKGISCAGYLTTREAAERLDWSYSKLHSRIGWSGIATSQEGSGHILIKEAEIEHIERDGWAAYRQSRRDGRYQRLCDELDELAMERRLRPAGG